MPHASSRPIRWILGCALVCSAFLSLPSAAHAQAPAVGSPFLGSVCLDPSDVTGELADPNAYYAAAPNCKSLCRKAETDCAQYVKLAAMCQRSEIDDDASYAKRECEVENEHGMQTTVCKQEVDQSARGDRSGASVDKNLALEACDKWEKTCEQTCLHP